MNDYVIGYDKGIKKDRSSLIISKYNNKNLYVLAEFYDEKADLLNEIITTLQQENKQLKEENKELNKVCELYGQSLYNADLTKMKNILTELEEWLKEEIINIKNNYSQVNGNYFNMNYKIETYEDTLDKIQELKEKYK